MDERLRISVMPRTVSSSGEGFRDSSSRLSRKARSGISTALSISSVETVSGGAIRHTDPRSAGRRRMFMLSPLFEALLGRQPAELVGRPPMLAIGDKLDAEQKAHALP